MLSWESSSFCLADAVVSVFSALLVVDRRCWWWVLWGGAEAKAFACLQADDGDAFGCRFSPWRHQSFALSPSVPPLAGRLVDGSSCVPALLHFTHCHLESLGCGGLLADGGSLALADALPL